MNAPPVDWSAIVGHKDVVALVDLALREDLGPGDQTTAAIFTGPQQIDGQLVARSPTVVCALPLAAHVFAQVGTGVRLVALVPEGTLIASGAPLAALSGDVRAMLAAERVALNFLMRLCGIAFGTRQMLQRLPEGCRARLYDTRKTTPGWRVLEKAAVRTGGGNNHRMGLFDGVLIKDNHVAALGSVGAAVRRARQAVGRSVPVQVEIDHLHQLDEALQAGPDIVLLDNFSLRDMRAAVQQVQGRILLEASGGVNAQTVGAIAATGVDRISVGALTHTVVPADLGLDMQG